MRILPLLSVLIVAVLGCGGMGDSVDVPLLPVGENGVTGTAHLEEAFCKSPCVKIRFDLPLDGASLRGEVRRGSCAAPGDALGGWLATSSSYEETVSQVSSLDELSGSHCVLAHDRSRLDQGIFDAPVACGDVP